jgi:hypothetical protein
MVHANGTKVMQLHQLEDAQLNTLEFHHQNAQPPLLPALQLQLLLYHTGKKLLAPLNAQLDLLSSHNHSSLIHSAILKLLNQVMLLNGHTVIQHCCILNAHLIVNSITMLSQFQRTLTSVLLLL